MRNDTKLKITIKNLRKYNYYVLKINYDTRMVYFYNPFNLKHHKTSSLSFSTIFEKLYKPTTLIKKMGSCNGEFVFSNSVNRYFLLWWDPEVYLFRSLFFL